MFLALAAAAQLAVRPALATEVRPGGSAEVMLSFPSSVEGISVGRAGEATFSLRIPTFPAYLEPDLSAVYSSRGGDGPLGMGWSIPIPQVTLDFANGPRVVGASPDDHIQKVGATRYLTDRWIAAPGGPLVCEPRPGENGASWRDDDCFTNPRGPIRFVPDGSADVLSWRATDPMEGVTQEFGTSAATRIMAGDKVVTWLLAREVTRDGKEVRHFYEERKGSDERLRVGVLMGGDKLVRFVYEARKTNRLSNYRLTVRRTTESLLKEIRLVEGCVPVQRGSGDDIWTDFSSCDRAPVREKIVLSYADPTKRGSGRYVLSAWQHMSGDGSVAFGPVKLAYNGDGSLAQRGIGLVTEEKPVFPMPAGSTLVSSSGHAPFQSYMDFNRDGLADWIDVKTNTSNAWPAPSTNHQIYVSLRDASGGFSARKTYRDPIARYAGWVWDDGASFAVHLDSLDRRDLTHQVPGSKAAAPAMIRARFPEATIAINSSPWLFRTPAKGDTTTFMPVIEGLSFSVKCSKLGTRICGDIKDTYRTVWGATLGTYDYVGVKLVDLQDMNGDGYLDRVVSGLLVEWDPNAPDADANGWRDPANGKPCVYVAQFDPTRDDFKPFVRYSISPPTGEFAQLDAAFLSALSVEVSHNQEPGAADMSNHGAPISGVSVAQLGLDFIGAVRQFADHHASAKPATDSGKGARSGTQVNRALAVGDVVLTAANLAAEWGGAPPEVQNAMRVASNVYGIGRTGLFLASVARDGVQGITQVGSVGMHLSLTGAQIVGWASFTSAIVGLVGYGISAIVVANAKHHMDAVGFNAGAVAASAKTTVSVISLTTASVAAIASGIGIGAALMAGGFATAWTGVGLIVAFVGAVIGIASAIGALMGSDGEDHYSEGSIKYDYYSQRGKVWRDKDVTRHAGSVRVLSTWADLDGDGRPDLLVAKHSAGSVGFAIASGDTDRGDLAPATAAWKTHGFPSASAPTELFRITTSFYFQPDDVQRGDQIDVERGLGDLNGDGLLDVMDTAATSPYGIGVYLNTGTGFAAKTTFAANASSAPASCNEPIHIARSRALSWTESVGRKEGYMVALSNTTQVLGPDLDGNGLPDLIMKDERSYNSIAGEGACVKSAGTAMCDAAMPTDPEPEKGNESCVAAKDVWFAEFDGWDKQDGTDEGRSHLTPAGFAVHSPSMLGDTYVAYNTGSGFLPFVKLDRKLPSFGGGLSVVSTTNTADFSPDHAVTGTSHFLADPDASGRLHLIGLDITQKGIWTPDGSHPVLHRYAFGIVNPDALTQVTYPDGGTAKLTYAVHADVQGQQGPPLMVLTGVVYDDLARASLQRLEGWSGSKPSVSYHYAGAKLVDREFRGFAAIAEERFSGTAVTQIIQVFNQDGPARGTIACTEVRGASIDVATPLSAVPEHATCEVARKVGTIPSRAPVVSLAPRRAAHPLPTVDVARESDATRIAGADRDTPLPDGVRPGQSPAPWSDDTGQVTSCYEAAKTRLGLPALYTLQQRVESGYTATASVNRRLPDGTTADVLRDFDLTRSTTSTYNGAGRASWTRLDIEYEPAPWKTPTATTLTTSDGVVRKTTTRWQHHRREWVSLRTEQVDLERNGTPHLTTRFRFGPAPAFHPAAVEQRSGGAVRVRELLSYDAGGLPTKIREGGLTTTYTYVPDRACGTGRMATVTRSTDGYQPAAGTETWSYDCLGRPTRVVSASGAVSTTQYDKLGVISREKPAGRAAIVYRHRAGTVSADRGRAALGGAARTEKVETTDGEQRVTTIWWDGMFREFRRGLSVEGTRTLDLDYNGDGTPERRGVGFPDDTRWFASRQAAWLLEDYLLDGLGQVQCRSTTYVDGHAPEAYTSTLFDPLRRPTLERRRDGFEVRTRFGVNGSKQMTEHVENQLGEFTSRTRDGLGRIIRESLSGLEVTTTRYGDWGGWTRRTDGLGFAAITERNAWDEPVRECRQVSGAVPAADACPAGWPTTTTTYDSAGHVATVTDPTGAVTRFSNANCGAPGRVELPPATTGDPASLGVVTTKFDKACRPSEVTEANGSVTRTAYDSAGRVSRITRALGKREETTERFGYDALGRLLFREDGLRRRSYQVLDFRDQLLFGYRPDGTREATTYDELGNIATIADATGSTKTLASDVMGRTTRISWSRDVCTAVTATSIASAASTVALRFGYDDKGRMTDSWDELGNRTHAEFDALDREVRRYAPSLTVPGSYDAATYVETTYDRAGRPISVRDRGGHVTQQTFDGAGRRTAVRSNASGHRIEQRFEYDAAGRVTRFLPANAQAAAANRCTKGAAAAADFAYDYAYSPRGLREKTLEPADASRARAAQAARHDAAGAVIAETDARGQVTATTVDALHRPVEQLDPDGARRRIGYDAASQVTELRDPRSLATVLRYDAAGHVTRVEPPWGVPTTRGYDGEGRLVFSATLADAAARRWEGSRVAYGPDGTLRAEEVTTFTGAAPTAASMTPLSRREQCTDAAGRVIAARDENGAVSKTTYDARGRVIERALTPVYGGAWEALRYTYDADDLVIGVTAPMGGTAAPATLVWRTTYDGAHRVISATDPYAADMTEWTHDDEGRICRRTNKRGATVTRSVELAYDARGLVVERRLSSGERDQLGYDAGGLPIAATDATGSWAWRRDAAGRVTEQKQTPSRLGATLVTTYAYKPGGLLEAATLPAIPGFAAGPSKIAFEYEATANRVRAVRTDRGDIATGITYDSRGRMASAKLGNGAIQNDRYDALGRLASRRVQFGAGDVMSAQYRHDRAGNLIAIDDQLDNAYDFAFTYDERSRLQSEAAPAIGGAWSYKLNAQDRIDQVTPPSGPAQGFRYGGRGNLRDAAGSAYASDDFGNRIADGRSGTRYTYDALDRMHSATTGPTTTEQRYAFDGRRVDAGQRVALFGLGHLPLAEVTLDGAGKPSAVRYRLSVGAFAQLVDAATGTTAQITTDHLGSPVLQMGATPGAEQRAAYSATGRMLPRPSPASLLNTPIGFQGAVDDRDLGLDLMVHRYYDPKTFEWLSPDPLGLAAGRSPHAFVGANPQRFTDPLGLDPDVYDTPEWGYEMLPGGANESVEMTPDGTITRLDVEGGAKITVHLAVVQANALALTQDIARMADTLRADDWQRYYDFAPAPEDSYPVISALTPAEERDLEFQHWSERWIGANPPPKPAFLGIEDPNDDLARKLHENDFFRAAKEAGYTDEDPPNEWGLFGLVTLGDIWDYIEPLAQGANYATVSHDLFGGLFVGGPLNPITLRTPFSMGSNGLGTRHVDHYDRGKLFEFTLIPLHEMTNAEYEHKYNQLTTDFSLVTQGYGLRGGQRVPVEESYFVFAPGPIPTSGNGARFYRQAAAMRSVEILMYEPTPGFRAETPIEFVTPPLLVP